MTDVGRPAEQALARQLEDQITSLYGRVVKLRELAADVVAGADGGRSAPGAVDDLRCLDDRLLGLLLDPGRVVPHHEVLLDWGTGRCFYADLS